MPTLDLTTFRAEDVRSTKRVIGGVYTGPASYATNGDPLVPADVKLGQLHVLVMGNPTNGSVILLTAYDYTNGKVKWFDLAGVEVTNGTNLSTYTTRFEAVGL